MIEYDFYFSPTQILYAKDIDQRSTTFEKSLQVGKMYQRRTRLLILRAAMLKNQIHVRVSILMEVSFWQRNSDMAFVSELELGLLLGETQLLQNDIAL